MTTTARLNEFNHAEDPAGGCPKTLVAFRRGRCSSVIIS